MVKNEWVWTRDFDYELDPRQIAQVPVEPRDSSRLLDARDGFNYRARVIDPQKAIT